MDREFVSTKAALVYLRKRLGAVSLELITQPDGMVTGHIFQVGRSKLVEGVNIRSFSVILFADGIVYSREKSERKAEAKRQQRMVADYIAEGLGEF
jgi:hypothetical protein